MCLRYNFGGYNYNQSLEEISYVSQILGHFWIEKREQKKKLGYYETENINNPWFVTLAVNPKEYFEIFKN